MFRLVVVYICKDCDSETAIPIMRPEDDNWDGKCTCCQSENIRLDRQEMEKCD